MPSVSSEDERKRFSRSDGAAFRLQAHEFDRIFDAGEDMSDCSLWVPYLREKTFSPQDSVSPQQSRNLLFSTVIDPDYLPIRPERHIPNAIATMRRQLTVALAKTLPRCPSATPFKSQ